MMLLDYRSIATVDELYDKLNVKWSWRRLWYVDDSHSVVLAEYRSVANMVLKWFADEKPYTNPDFSFKDLSARFPDLDYQEFGDALQEMGLGNFQSYVRSCRIELAIKMIEEDDGAHMNDIALRVGFNSSSAFSRSFKAVTGVSATQWRSSNRGEE